MITLILNRRIAHRQTTQSSLFWIAGAHKHRYIGKATQGFEQLRPASFNLATRSYLQDFHAPIADERLIRQKMFTDFRKRCYPYQKLQSVKGEWRPAQWPEDDPDVSKWMKPAVSTSRWRGQVDSHAAAHDDKRWHYLLAPDTAIQLGRSLRALRPESTFAEK